jgi:molybdenum cofactor synthesis domain-containing protein
LALKKKEGKMILEAAVVTISDRSYAGTRPDEGGPAVAAALAEAGWSVAYTGLVPDEKGAIRAEIEKCVDALAVQLVVTTGGTGISPRDVTAEATMEALDFLVPGIPEAMRAASMATTPNGMLSRGLAGVRGGSLVVNLPGKPAAALECLAAGAGARRHGVEMRTGEDPGSGHYHN